jgi:hypothetical protein
MVWEWEGYKSVGWYEEYLLVVQVEQGNVRFWRNTRNTDCTQIVGRGKHYSAFDGNLIMCFNKIQTFRVLSLVKSVIMREDRKNREEEEETIPWYVRGKTVLDLFYGKPGFYLRRTSCLHLSC